MISSYSQSIHRKLRLQIWCIEPSLSKTNLQMFLPKWFAQSHTNISDGTEVQISLPWLGRSTSVHFLSSPDDPRPDFRKYPVSLRPVFSQSTEQKNVLIIFALPSANWVETTPKALKCIEQGSLVTYDRNPIQMGSNITRNVWACICKNPKPWACFNRPRRIQVLQFHSQCSASVSIPHSCTPLCQKAFRLTFTKWCEDGHPHQASNQPG